MAFWKTVIADLGAYHRRDLSQSGWGFKARKFLRGYLDTEFRVVFQTRVINRLSRSRFKSLGLLLYYRQKSRYCVDISPWAEIGPGLRLQHPFNIVIGPGARIGSNCILFNGVTLGNARPDILVNRMPVVGDGCVLGTGAKILGAVVVEEGLLVGANVLVRKDLVRGGDYFAQLEGERKVRVLPAGAAGSAIPSSDMTQNLDKDAHAN